MTQVTQELRILIIEDSETDALLLMRHISKSSTFKPVFERVDNAGDMAKALAESHWDIVISDHNLPLFSSFGALELLQKTGLDVPFIIISGVIGEEVAVEALKAGAHDYLLKDKLTRLVPAIERELKKAKERQHLREVEAEKARLADQLKKAKEQAELANQRKSKVLAFVAHEFKNPLTAIATFSELLDKGTAGPLSEKQKEFTQYISTACQHLRDLMNDILDIAPIEAGTIQLNLQELDLPSLVDEVRIIGEALAKRKEIELQIEIDSSIQIIVADAKRLRQILINLISNAIKYTSEKDTVALKVLKTNDNAWIEFQVSDHGIGIPENELEKLFQDYYRVRSTVSTQREGLGLGLALCKTLVELHQGTITVDSRENEGSTFTVVLPYQDSLKLQNGETDKAGLLVN